jgi:uncharacterized membrane protein
MTVHKNWKVLAIAGVIVGSLALFLAAPWSLQEKSLAALHGLCAQQPTHSFWFGDSRLPFDARMTGIYGGFLIVFGYLLARGRLYRIGVPPSSIILGLGGFIAIMGVDGVNSTLNDVGLPHVYEPSNHLRFFTGALTGTTLAVFTWLLAASVLWSPDVASRKPLMRSWKEFLPIALIVVMFWMLLQLDWPPLFAPLAILLVFSAVLVLSTIALAAIALLSGAFQRATHPSELAGRAVAAVLLAYLVMSSIAGARFMLEAAMVG